MKRFIVIFLVAILAIGCCQNIPDTCDCSYDFSQPISLDTIRLNIPTDTFAQTIIDIETRIVDLTYIGAVFNSDKFIYIYEHAPYHINNVIQYLSDTNHSMQRRTIALLSMCRQDLDNNLNFLFACESLYKRSLIKEDFIMYVLFPPVLSNRDLIKYYDNEKIRRVLTDIRNNPQTSENFRATIDDILSGKRYKDEKAFLRDAEGIDI
jgi:hypothetical protein